MKEGVAMTVDVIGKKAPVVHHVVEGVVGDGEEGGGMTMMIGIAEVEVIMVEIAIGLEDDMRMITVVVVVVVVADGVDVGEEEEEVVVVAAAAAAIMTGLTILGVGMDPDLGLVDPPEVMLSP
jgi:hypothetical protein